MVGIGAAGSTAIDGALIQHLGYRASFLGLAGIALLAFALLWLAVPETRDKTNAESGARRHENECSAYLLQYLHDLRMVRSPSRLSREQNK
jgi:predicted MFS family arabinose efflux permease